MGDIALAYGDPIVAHTPIDDELEQQQQQREQQDAPAAGKYNATFQSDLEKLKQEVYHEGLQVEEEGLTDIIRKKTKLPGVNAISQTTGQPPAAVQAAPAAASAVLPSTNNDASVVSCPPQAVIIFSLHFSTHPLRAPPTSHCS